MASLRSPQHTGLLLGVGRRMHKAFPKGRVILCQLLFLWLPCQPALPIAREVDPFGLAA